MKFELTESIAVANPDRVLQVLERHLHAVAGDVEFEGDKLVAYGIGPSPRTINRRDVTVIGAQLVAGETLLRIDVNYQASALLGNMPQDGIVRSKIEGAIDEMRGELSVWKPRTPVQEIDAPAYSSEVKDSFEAASTQQEQRKFEGTSEPMPFAPYSFASPRFGPAPEPAAPVLPVEPATQPVRSQEVQQVIAAHDLAQSEKILEVAPAIAITPEAVSVLPAESMPVSDAAETTPAVTPVRQPIRLSKSKRKIGRRPQADTAGDEKAKSGVMALTPAPQQPVVTPSEVSLQSLVRSQGSDVESADRTKRGSWVLAAGVTFVLILALIAAGFVLRDALPFPEPWKVMMANWQVQANDQIVAIKAKIKGERPVVPAPAPVLTPPLEEAKPDTVTDPEVMVRPQTNVYLWLQDWAAAMRSEDPVAQASYYADSVDRYLTDTAVTQAFVEQQKKADIENRQGLWTIKVEHMYVQRQAASEAQVKVVKHRIVQNPDGKVVESLTKTRLRLVRVHAGSADATWKIAEEEDLN